jgi:tetratricopeptide (TPR) repeat protein
VSNLQTLDLAANQLSTLPESIGQLNNLQTLNLNYNHLGTLPESIGQLHNLQILDLSSNPKLFPYDSELVEEELKTFLNKIAKREIEFDPKGRYLYYYVEQLEQLKQNSTSYYAWYDLSYYALFVNKPQEAIHAAQKALTLNSTQVSAEAKLALGYLLNNQYAEAEKIYLKWKGKSFPGYNDQPCNDIFLQDIATLEAAGITHSDFERMRLLLKEK